MVATWITLTTVIIGFVAAVLGYLRVREKQEVIHVLVNSNLNKVVQRVDQLIIVLKQHGIEVPDDPEKALPKRGKLMPYEVKQDGENYQVVNSETHAVKATHEPPDAKGKAERQVRLLEAVENDPNWEE